MKGSLSNWSVEGAITDAMIVRFEEPGMIVLKNTTVNDADKFAF